MDDTSLDEFLDSGSESDSERPATGDHPDEAESGDGTERAASDGAAPATTTSRWAADGVVCALCESSVQRVWESADGLVCAACKEW